MHLIDHILGLLNLGALALALRSGLDFAAAAWGILTQWDPDDAL